ncbi:conserved hypothetical protein [Gammaproteobacteria bacterium]
MLDNGEITHIKYESPVIVSLGEMAKGMGSCLAGSGDKGDCTMGGLADNACTAGPINNAGTCSAGGSANPSCTGGAAPEGRYRNLK